MDGDVVSEDAMEETFKMKGDPSGEKRFLD
jgi:hypothetical protein